MRHGSCSPLGRLPAGSGLAAAPGVDLARLGLSGLVDPLHQLADAGGGVALDPPFALQERQNAAEDGHRVADRLRREALVELRLHVGQEVGLAASGSVRASRLRRSQCFPAHRTRSAAVSVGSVNCSWHIRRESRLGSALRLIGDDEEQIPATRSRELLPNPTESRLKAVTSPPPAPQRPLRSRRSSMGLHVLHGIRGSPRCRLCKPCFRNTVSAISR
jgi:hypothetical protein